MLSKNKKGQIGETLTWIVATLIIIVLLIVFIYASIALGKAKNISTNKIENNEAGWIEFKTLTALNLNSENKNQIETWIKEVEEDEKE